MSSNGEWRSPLQAFEHAISGGGERRSYTLRLYVTGSTPRSQRAIANVRRICEEHLPGRYDLQVIDLYQQPELARGQQVLAAPTLVKTLPEPLRRLIGDMSDEDRVLISLDLRPGGRDAEPRGGAL